MKSIYANNEEFDQLNTKMAPYEHISLTSIKEYIVSKYNEGYRSGMFSIINPSDGPLKNDSWTYQIMFNSSVSDGVIFVLLSRSYTDVLYYRYIYAPNNNWDKDWFMIPSINYINYFKLPGRIVYYEFTFSRETNIDNFYYPETFGKIPNVIALRIADVNLIKDENISSINSFPDHIQITRISKEAYGGGTVCVTLYIDI